MSKQTKETPREKLYMAIREGDMTQVLELVKKVNKNKKFPLHWGDESMKKFRNRWWNWLHYSVFFNQLEIVKHLVEVVKIDVNIQTILIVSRSKYFFDDTALHIAAREGHVAIIKYLLTKEIQKEIKNYGGKKANEVLTENECVIKLIDTGVYPTEQPKEKSSIWRLFSGKKVTHPDQSRIEEKEEDGQVDSKESDFSSKPPPTNGEEMHQLMKEMEQRIMNELQEKMKREDEKLKHDMKQENEKLREEMKLLKITCYSQEQQIEELKKKNEELRMKHEGIVLKLEDHFEMYHRTKYSLESSITPQMLKKSDQVNYCFENDTFQFRFRFSIQGGRSDEKKFTIDFERLKMFMNGEHFSRFKISNNSIEFELTFPKIGRNELTCLFQNIKKTFVIDVEPSSLCTDRCDLLFYRADLEPSGDLTPSPQPTEKFSSSDIIQIVLKLVNKNGAALLPKYLDEEELDVKMVKIDGRKKKKVREVLSRDSDITIDQIDTKTGEFCVCSIEENKLEKGKYEVKVDGAEVEVKKIFSVY